MDGGKFLQSFDGYRFIQYHLPDKNKVISCIFENHQGTIFVIADYNYVYTFNRTDHTFNNVTHVYNKAKNNITQALMDDQQRVWLNLTNNLGLINQNGEFSIIDSPFGKNYAIAGGIFIENKNKLWFVVKDIGIVRFDTRHSEWTMPARNKKNEKIFNYPAQHVSYITKDFQGNYWLVEKQSKLVKYNAEEKKNKIYVIPYTTSINNKDNNTFLAKILLDKKGQYMGIAWRKISA